MWIKTLHLESTVLSSRESHSRAPRADPKCLASLIHPRCSVRFTWPLPSPLGKSQTVWGMVHSHVNKNLVEIKIGERSYPFGGRKLRGTLSQPVVDRMGGRVGSTPLIPQPSHKDATRFPTTPRAQMFKVFFWAARTGLSFAPASLGNGRGSNWP